MTSVSQTQHDNDLALNGRAQEGVAGAPAPYVDDHEGNSTGFTGWSLEVACGNAQLW